MASKDQSKLSEPIKELDILLTQVHRSSFSKINISVKPKCLTYYTCVKIAAGVPIDIMPGPSDPANFSLPQQVRFRALAVH